MFQFSTLILYKSKSAVPPAGACVSWVRVYVQSSLDVLVYMISIFIFRPLMDDSFPYVKLVAYDITDPRLSRTGASYI